MGRAHKEYHIVDCEWCGFTNNPNEIMKEWIRRDPHYSMSYPCESCGGTLSAKLRADRYFTLRYDGKSRRRRLIQAGSKLLRLPIPKQYQYEKQG
jgi:hypothetical protein